MKYHWIGFNQNNDDKNLELKIPENPQTLTSNTPNNSLQRTVEEDDFQPKIIPTLRFSSLIINMNKAQVIESCTQLIKKKTIDADLLALAVGDCVISNYKDPMTDTKVEDDVIRSTKSRQAQLRRINLLKACQQSLIFENYSNEIDKQLLLGICISRKR